MIYAGADSAEEVTEACKLRPGQTMSRTMVVLPGQTLCWSFSVEARDLNFSVVLHERAGTDERESGGLALVEAHLISSSHGTVHGTWAAPPTCVKEAGGDGLADKTPPAMVELLWSNAHSWLSFKTVKGLQLSVG